MSQTTEPAPGAIIRDDELRAINTIVKLLSALDEPGRRRVLAYVNGRFPAPEKE